MKLIASKSSAAPSKSAQVIDLDQYIPAYLIWIANKLTRGSSMQYLNLYGVGAEMWRCLVLLAIHDTVSAQQVCQIIGLDKASVSRCFKQMLEKKLITMALDPKDGRIRRATLTMHGRKLHDEILGIALERERALLSVLSEGERASLLGMLKRLHENLPAVEEQAQQYVEQNLGKPSYRNRKE